MLGAAVLIGATVGCSGRGSIDQGGIRGAGTGVPIVAIASSDVETTIVGGSAKQQAALRKILTGIGPTSIERIEIGRPESGWKPFDEGDVAVSFATEGGPKTSAASGRRRSWRGYFTMSRTRLDSRLSS